MLCVGQLFSCFNCILTHTCPVYITIGALHTLCPLELCQFSGAQNLPLFVKGTLWTSYYIHNF